MDTSFGLMFTHILRLIILKLNLTPPIFGKQWIVLFSIMLLICVAYSYLNSIVVEWLHLFDPKIKRTLPEQFYLNLTTDSPIILIWLFIYYLWHYIENSRNAKIDRVKMENLVKELQLKTTEAHISPDFISNTFNSIRALVDTNPEHARTAITELSIILRSSMHGGKTEATALEKELLELQQIRFENGLKMKYEIDKDTLDQLPKGPPPTVQGSDFIFKGQLHPHFK